MLLAQSVLGEGPLADFKISPFFFDFSQMLTEKQHFREKRWKLKLFCQ
jgi:hypothetical protein